MEEGEVEEEEEEEEQREDEEVLEDEEGGRGSKSPRIEKMGFFPSQWLVSAT